MLSCVNSVIELVFTTAPTEARHIAPMAARHIAPMAARHIAPMAARHIAPMAARHIAFNRKTSERRTLLTEHWGRFVVFQINCNPLMVNIVLFGYCYFPPWHVLQGRNIHLNASCVAGT